MTLYQIPDPPVLQGYSLSTAQRTAVLTRGGDVAVTAGAGTGKTRTLVARYLSLLAEGMPLRRIVAVTFTRKAAREMRNRVRRLIGDYLNGNPPPAEQAVWRQHYQELDAARIGTIHNLCGEILRAHPAEAGLDPRFAVLDENMTALLVGEAVEAALAWAVSPASPAGSTAMDPLFAVLSERAVQDLIGTMVSRRLAVGEIVAALPPEAIGARWQEQLALLQETAVAAFLTDPAVIDARETVRRTPPSNPGDKLAVQQQDMRSMFLELEHAPAAEQCSHLSRLDGIRLNVGSQKSWPGGKEDLTNIKEALRTLRDRYRSTPHFTLEYNEQDEALAAAMPAMYALYAYAHETYTALKTEREGVDFDDLEGRSIALLKEHSPIRRYWQEQIGALLVDEFQDTNGRQQQFMRLLCPQPGKLFIVGDAKQSIYRFRGADVAVFDGEKKGIAAAGGALVDLDTSYRAHEALLTGMNQLLRPILGDDSPDRPAYRAPFAPLRPANITVLPGLTAPFVEFHLGAGNKKEGLAQAAAGLAIRLAELQQTEKIRFGDMAILCRASSAFRYYEDALDAAGIPYVTVAGRGFYGRPEIRDLLNALQTLADPHDNLALAGLLRSPALGLSDASLYPLFASRPTDRSLWTQLLADEAPALPEADEADRLARGVALIRDLQQLAGRVRVADLLKRFLDRTRYRAILNRLGQPRALRNVDKLLADIHESRLVSVDAFLEMVNLVRDSGTREGEARAAETGAVRIMSIHAAKGLEFPVVVLGDAAGSPRSGGAVLFDPDWGILLPHKGEGEQKAASSEAGQWLADQQDDAEAARLLYVALTRAEQMLLINGHFSLKRNGDLSFNSGWLGQLAAETGLADARLDEYDAEGAAVHEWETVVGETAVRAILPEPNHPFPLPDVALLQPAAEEEITVSPLQQPLPMPPPEVEEEERERQVWRVVPDSVQPRAPAWLIGRLVHESLAGWRFPDEQFAGWARARSWEMGLTDSAQVDDAVQVTTRLLRRFQGSDLYREIGAAAIRRHELPYVLPAVNGEREKFGVIDLLYRRGERWVIVDFKSDRLRSVEQMQAEMARKKYPEQVRRYGRAVQTFLGELPLLRLCFLDVDGGVRVFDVEV